MDTYIILHRDQLQRPMFWSGDRFEPEYPQATIFESKKRAKKVAQILAGRGYDPSVISNYGQDSEKVVYPARRNDV